MLPTANTLEEYRSINKQDASFIEAARFVLQKQNIQLTESHFATSGSLPVLIVNNEFIFKFFPPIFAAESPTESSALEFLTQNNCASPKLLAHEDFNDELKFQGFIDFEPSRLGAAEYDFASVGVFLTSGNKQALRAFFEGYRILELASTKNFKRRVMAYTLLHQYSNLKWYLEFMPVADTLDELSELWWAT